MIVILGFLAVGTFLVYCIIREWIEWRGWDEFYMFPAVVAYLLGAVIILAILIANNISVKQMRLFYQIYNNRPTPQLRRQAMDYNKNLLVFKTFRENPFTSWFVPSLRGLDYIYFKDER